MNHKHGLRLLKKIYHKIRPLAVEWRGDYSSWSAAAADCRGYDAQEIVERSLNATLQVVNGSAKFARDGVTFYSIEYNWQLISVVQRISSALGRPIQVLDFGGAFGDTYLQNQKMIADFILSWRVVEQESMLNEANRIPPINRLSFTKLGNLKKGDIDLIVLSSVLQYLPDYYAVVIRLKNLESKGIFVDRTGFVEKPRLTQRITKQIVRPPIYSATYPCRFFVKNDFMALFEPYKPVAEWNALDSANIPSQYLGIFFERQD